MGFVAARDLLVQEKINGTAPFRELCDKCAVLALFFPEKFANILDSQDLQRKQAVSS